MREQIGWPTGQRQRTTHQIGLERQRWSLILALLFTFHPASNHAAHADEICVKGLSRQVHIGEQSFNVSVAASQKDRERGLSGYRALAAETGMLFTFPAPGWHGFWMQDMKFPIDLIWITPERKVLGAITLQPCTDKPCAIYLPPSQVAYVLEINAGAFTGKQGDDVTWHCTRCEK